MYKKMLSLLLIASMMAASLPLVLPVAAAGAEESISTTFVEDSAVAVTDAPLTYYAWAETNSGLDTSAADYADKLTAYMETNEAKAAFKAYFFTMGKVVWSGDWMTGQIDYRTGEFSPTAYRIPFVNPGVSWSAWSGNDWYSSKPVAEAFLDKYLAKSFPGLWSIPNTPMHFQLESTSKNNQARLSTAGTSYLSYTYTIPADASSTVELMMLPDDNTILFDDTAICVMKNEEIIWPSGADITDSSTWACNLFSKYELVAKMEGLSTSVKPGDKIHFVVTGAGIIRLNPRVTYTNSNKWEATNSNFGKDVGLDGIAASTVPLLSYEEFCAQALTNTDQSAKDAYTNYVLNYTSSITFTGNWSVGQMVLSGDTYIYDPFAYRLRHAGRTWDQIDGTRRVATASVTKAILEGHLISSTSGSDGLWGRDGAIYGTSAGTWTTEITTLNNAQSGSDAKTGIAAWAYTVPSGVSEVTPSVHTKVFSSAVANAKSTRICITKNGTPVWPSNATVELSTWADQTNQSWAAVCPTVDELNDEWKNLRIPVQEGDIITICIKDLGGAELACNYSMTDTVTNTVDSYDPAKIADGPDPVCYNDFCAANSPARATNTAYARDAYERYCAEQAIKGILTYEEFCAQALTNTDQSAKDAYAEYVLNYCTAVTWTGNWSAGNSVLQNGKYIYQPLANRTWWDSAVTWDGIGNGARYATAEAAKKLLSDHLISTGSSADTLWGRIGVVYGERTWTGYVDIAKLYNSCNTEDNIGILTWGYTVPSGVTELAPSVSADIMSGSAHANTRLCIMKNGVPIWPIGATTNRATWATQTSHGWTNVYPTAAELNAAWKDLRIAVRGGDLITVCIADTGGPNAAYKGNFTMTDTATSSAESYVPAGFTVQDAPVSYNDFCASGSTARASDTAYAKHAYPEHVLESLKLSYHGNWSVGQTANGTFRPIAYLNIVQGNTYEDGFSLTATPYLTTETGLRTLLATYLGGETAADQAALLSDALLALDAALAQPQHGYVATQGSSNVLTYRYTMPQAGRVKLSLADGFCTGGNAYVCVLVDGNLVWPSGAVYGNVSTWATLTPYNLPALNRSLASVKPYAEAGEKIEFCIAAPTAAAGSSYALDPTVEIFTPLADLFTLQAAVSLGRSFGLSFVATYPDKAVADAATVTLTPSSAVAAHITKSTADVENEDGTLTRYYSLKGFAARELTETITYTVNASAFGESKTASGSVTVADLVAYHLKKDGDIVDTTDATSALALATLNYAAAAQSYFSYHTDKLANATVPEGQRTAGVKVSERTLADAGYSATEGASLHFTGATLLLNDVVTLKFFADAEEPINDPSALSLVIKTADGKAYVTETAISFRDDDKDHTSIKVYADIPMLYYSSSLTFGVYEGDVLISDELTYGVGCYAKRTYGTSATQDAVLDTMLALGDAATDYRNNVENVLINGGAAIPAEPGETIDLSCYPVLIGGAIHTGDEVKWSTGCNEVDIVQGKYALAPQTAGRYQILVSYGEYVISTAIAVCDANGAYTTDTVDRNAAASVDLSGYGKAAAQAGVTVPDYWTWSLHVAAYEANKNAAATNSMSSFFFVTDTHWENNNKRTFEIANYLYEEAGIEELVFGGDYVNGAPLLTTVEPYMLAFRDAIETFRGRWYAVRGNHDNNAAWTASTPENLWSDADYFEKFLKYSDGASADGKLYNYVDDEDAKIRYYFLDDGSEKHFEMDSLNVIDYATQLTWLQETAVELEDGWGIVVFQHQADNFSGRLEPVLNEIDKTNEVIAVIGGHHHWNASHQADGGYYVITTTCDAGGSTSEHYDNETPYRTEGTRIEQLMEIVQIDREHRKVYLIRVGDGVNRTFDY